MTKERKTSVIVKPKMEESVTKKSQKTRIYVGPTITNVIKRNSIYVGDLPPIEADFLKKNPFFNCLLIEVDKLPQFINSQQYSILYDKAANSIRR